MRIVLAIVASIVVATIAAAAAGTAGWNRESVATVARLTTPAGTAAAYRAAALEPVPPPAERYFRAVLKDGQRIVRSAIAMQEAEFFINGGWRPLQATQHFTTSPPGFVWDARIGMMPLVSASVRDAYVGSRGLMQASIFGLYTLADQADKPELNAGALQRYLGEAVWFPTALLPSSTVTWSALDDCSARVSLRDGATSVSLLFEFNQRGLPIRITGSRYKENGGAYTLQPWQIRCDDHAERDGMVIPLGCEVSWLSNGTAEPYWRGRITSITYRYD